MTDDPNSPAGGPAPVQETSAPQPEPQPAQAQPQQSQQPQQPQQPTAEQTARALQQAYGNTTVQRAVNILEAAAIQREAINKAFLAQKEAMQDAVEAQRASALQQLAEARHQHSAQQAKLRMSEAQSATSALANATREAVGGEAVPTDVPPPQAAPAPTEAQTQAQTQAPAQAQTQAPKTNPGTPTFDDDLGSAINRIKAGADPLAALPGQSAAVTEFVETIRNLIQEEVSSRMKVLMAANPPGTKATGKRAAAAPARKRQAPAKAQKNKTPAGT
ncbi:MAG: hypothetical protein EP335_11690 [Alphaproteobacteria bacterium]|nr:MAG: hypothetical protein EP335_11690 [Alphaproteobacteria bacterium]